MQYLKIATFVMLLSIIPTWRKQIARNYALNPAANRLKKAKFSRYGLEGLLTGLGIEVVD